jgi:hypothetical protein
LVFASDELQLTMIERIAPAMFGRSRIVVAAAPGAAIDEAIADGSPMVAPFQPPACSVAKRARIEADGPASELNAGPAIRPRSSLRRDRKRRIQLTVALW